jgi:hypothetical protein
VFSCNAFFQQDYLLKTCNSVQIFQTFQNTKTELEMSSGFPINEISAARQENIRSLQDLA